MKAQMRAFARKQWSGRPLDSTAWIEAGKRAQLPPILQMKGQAACNGIPGDAVQRFLGPQGQMRGEILCSKGA